MSDFEKEERYYVFKISDIENNAPKHVSDNFKRLAGEYYFLRESLGKNPLECVVVESDWPMYNKVWKWIEKWVASQKGRQVKPHRSGRVMASHSEADLKLFKKRIFDD